MALVWFERAAEEVLINALLRAPKGERSLYTVPIKTKSAYLFCFVAHGRF